MLATRWALGARRVPPSVCYFLQATIAEDVTVSALKNIAIRSVHANSTAKVFRRFFDRGDLDAAFFDDVIGGGHFF